MTCIEFIKDKELNMSEKEVLTGEADILLVFCLASSETPAAKTQIGICRFMSWRCHGSSHNAANSSSRP